VSKATDIVTRLLEADDLDISPERYIRDLPHTFMSVGAEFGLRFQRTNNAYWTGGMGWKMIPPLRTLSGAQYSYLTCYVSVFDSDRDVCYFQLYWHLNSTGPLALFQSERQPLERSVQTLRYALMRMTELGDKACRLAYPEPTTVKRFIFDFSKLPEFSAVTEVEGLKLVPARDED